MTKTGRSEAWPPPPSRCTASASSDAAMASSTFRCACRSKLIRERCKALPRSRCANARAPSPASIQALPRAKSRLSRSSVARGSVCARAASMRSRSSSPAVKRFSWARTYQASALVPSTARARSAAMAASSDRPITPRVWAICAQVSACAGRRFAARVKLCRAPSLSPRANRAAPRP